MKCPNCGTENIIGAEFCQECGANLSAFITCPNCHHLNPTDAQFCESCGQPLPHGPAPATPQQATQPTQAQPAQPTQAQAAQPAPAVAPVPPTQPTNDRHTVLYIGIGAAALVVVVAAIFVAFSLSGSKQAPKPAAKSAKSSVVVKSSAKSSKAPATLPTAKLQQIATSTLGGLSGTTSAYVSKIGTSGTFVTNNQAQRAASDIKIFIMATVYQKIADGAFTLDDTYTIADADKVGGTGVMRTMADGTTLTLRQVMKYMMADSDNMAANVIIDRVGGLDAVNSEISDLGATDTTMARKLMDTAALKSGRDNMTSVRDLGNVLTKIYNHQLISAQADDAMLDLMAKDSNQTKLPAQITGATIYNKTGEFGQYGVQNDAAIIHNSKGTIVAVVMGENGSEAAQIQAESNFGGQIYQLLLNGEAK